MKRREFVITSAAGLSTMPFWTLNHSYSGDKKPGWLVELIKLNDQTIPALLQKQVIDQKLKSFGGFLDEDAIPNPQSTSHFISTVACAISCPESEYYHSIQILEKIGSAIQYLLRVQHEDGTIDLLATNFHSTPDTAFSVEKIVPAYHFINQSKIKNSDTTLEAIKKYLQRAGECLIVGGIHTPNHRWVVSAALTLLNELWPDPRYVARAEEWLAEHIDTDPDGQYTEKSTGGYTPLVNRVLILIAKGLDKPYILDHVRKNLNMTMYYVHPNGEVVTEASNRQDKGTIGTLDGYYYTYRYLALLDRNGTYAAMCRLIEMTCFPKLVSSLDYLLMDPKVCSDLPATQAIPESYAQAFPYSGVVRIRRADWDLTLLSKNPGFLTFHKGNAVLQAMRINASFFGKAQFQSAAITQERQSWLLKNELEGPYYQPYPTDQIDPNGDLSKMPRTNRSKSEVQHLYSTIKITEIAGGVQVDFELTGTDNVPVSLELIFRPGGQLNGVMAHDKKPQAFLFAGDQGAYTVGQDQLMFSGGRVEHKGVYLRGGLPPQEAPSVYITGFTPFVHTLKLT